MSLIIVTGPIGFGKSTAAELLKMVLGNVVVIDGDAEVLTKSGRNRNLHTQALVIRHLAQGKIVILSTGGGAICTPPNHNPKKGLPEKPALLGLMEKTGLNCPVHLLHAPLEEYDNEEATRSVLEHREWEVEKVLAISKGNKKFAQILLDAIPSKMTFPRQYPTQGLTPEIEAFCKQIQVESCEGQVTNVQNLYVLSRSMEIPIKTKKGNAIQRIPEVLHRTVLHNDQRESVSQDLLKAELPHQTVTAATFVKVMHGNIVVMAFITLPASADLQWCLTAYAGVFQPQYCSDVCEYFHTHNVGELPTELNLGGKTLTITSFETETVEIQCAERICF